MNETPPAVSKRNHFHSAETLVEEHYPYLPASLRTQELRDWLRRFTERVIQSVAWNFATGAERGIRQTAQLLVDPEYYATLGERRRKEKQRYEEQHRRQELTRAERQLCPTEEQIAEDIKGLEQWIASSEDHVVRMKERLRVLKVLRGQAKHVRFPGKPQ